VPRGATWPSTGGARVGSLTAELRHVLAGYRWLAGEDVDLVHDHSVIGPSVGRAVIDRPIVTTNHGPFAGTELGDVYRLLPDGIHVVAISEHQSSTAEGVPIAAVIHHGVDCDAVPPGSGGGDADGPYLAFLGRMASDKGVDVAIDVARGAGMRLLIAAKMHEPEEEAYFERSIRPRLGDDVRYIGEVPCDAKYAFLGEAVALLNPIRWPEPFGLVMIESLACGTPVVTTPQGAAPEIVTDGVTGALCDDAAAMVTAVRCTPFIDRALCRAEVQRRFSTERMVEDHLALYERVRLNIGLTGSETAWMPSHC
jgi:glycosyltransferase involved in cell wall biosynthesis